LSGERRSRFQQAYADAVQPHYPRRPDGTTILPFERLFMVARMAA
jgi:trans-aconitate 2-methyltransferase